MQKLLVSYHVLDIVYLDLCYRLYIMHQLNLSSCVVFSTCCCLKLTIYLSDKGSAGDNILTLENSYKHTLKKMGILTLCDLNNLLIGCFMHKTVNNTLPEYHTSMFALNSSVRTHNTRRKHDVHIIPSWINVHKICYSCAWPTCMEFSGKRT